MQALGQCDLVQFLEVCLISLPPTCIFGLHLPWPNCHLECSEEKVSGDGFWSVDSNFRFLFLLEDTWTSEATVQFQELCYSKVLVGIVDEYVNGILHLFLCDTSSEEDVYIHSVLKDKGYADICKENLPSQVRREECAAVRKGRGRVCWVPIMERYVVLSSLKINYAVNKLNHRNGLD